jgi:hypothetical protein
MAITFPSKRIMPGEFEHRFRNRLASSGLSSYKIDHLSEVASSALYEQGSHRGIDRREKAQLVEALRAHRFQNHFTQEDLSRVEQAFLDER